MEQGTKHILTIDPDIDQLFIDKEGVSYSYDNNGLLDYIYTQQGEEIIMKELKDWCDEMFSIVVASECLEPYEKDWKDYHKRGIELAYKLREVLSTDFDLWYRAPFEDKSNTIPQPIHITIEHQTK